MPLNLWNRAKARFARATPEPDPVDALFQAAMANHQQGQLAEAERLYKAVLERQENHSAALNFLGVLAYQSRDHQRSFDLISKAVALDPDNPGLHANLALPLNGLARDEEAIESCDRAIALDPDCVAAHSNGGNSLWGMGRRDEALANYARAIAIQPDHAQSHWNSAFILLQLGRFEEGWLEHEWRWQLPHLAPTRRDFAQPLWLGKESLEGKTILLHAEQGLGDTLHLCRYAKLVAARGARVVLEVNKPLKSLLSNLEGVTQVLARGEPLPAFDMHCPISSLPLAFKTDLGNIPVEHRYIYCDPASIAQWRERLELLGPRGSTPALLVGLTWRSTEGARSLPLAGMLKLVDKDAQFFSFQQSVSAAENDLLQAYPDVLRLTEDLTNFSDAPLVELMDLVITCDTSMAQLAGALGKAVWVMLPFNPDWRWMLEREDSPWHPGVRLFRQPKPDDWVSVITNVGTALRELQRTHSRGAGR